MKEIQVLTRSMKKVHKPKTTSLPKCKENISWIHLIPNAKQIASSFNYSISNDSYSPAIIPSLKDTNEVNLILHEVVNGIKNHGIPDVTEITNTTENVKSLLKAKGFQVTEYLNNGMYKCFVGLP